MRVALGSLIVALALTGCSSGGNDPAPTQSASESLSIDGDGATAPTDGDDLVVGPDLETSVRMYNDAFLTGDASTAYDLLTQRCREALPLSEFAAAVEEAGKLYGGALDFTSYDQQIDGNTATVTYRYQASGIDQVDEPWVLEDDTWHNAEC